MSGRKCGNCRHYEPSPIWRSGWCRNPRLYGPQESHLVRQDELACAHRIGNYWEAVEDDAADGAGAKPGLGALGGIVKPLRLFGPGPGPRLVAATSGSSGGGRFGAGGGGTGGDAGGTGSLSSSGAGRDAYDDGGGTGGSGGARPPQGSPGGSGRPDRTGRLPGQERSVSYQPEERYWTDYLRIALPVVGLLLMLGLFWFWAANLIADDDDDDPPATLDVAAVATATATVPPAPGGGAGETPPAGATEPQAPAGDAEATEPPAEDGAADDPPPDEEDVPPDEEENAAPGEGEDASAEDGELAEGTLVQVTEDVNLRSETNVADDTILRVLEAGEELTILAGPFNSEGFTWYEVEDQNGDAGYVVIDFIEPIEE